MHSAIHKQIVFAFCFIATEAVFRVGYAGDGQRIVTVVTKSPIEHLDSTEHLDSVTMAAPNSQYALVRAEGDKVILTDSTGALFRISIAATDFVTAAPMAPASPGASSTIQAVGSNDREQRGSPSLATTNLIVVQPPQFSPVSSAAPSQQAAQSGKQDSISRKFNILFGGPLLAETELWQEDGDAVGTRLKWVKDSVTSYRAHGLACLGALAKSNALYLRNGKPDYLCITFDNKGNYSSDYAIRTAIKNLHDKISRVLGPSSECVYGGTANIPADRWDLNSTSILLLKDERRYVGLIICPTDFADNSGMRKDWSVDAVAKEIVSNVGKADASGKVTLQNIPAVNQGHIGYCTPASFERYLRYLGIPGDMYLLAIIENTGEGGGTNGGKALVQQMQAYVDCYGMRIVSLDPKISIETIARYIDQGKPLLWNCTLHGVEGHTRLIVGYNATTKEIATSDSWSSGITVETDWISVSRANDDSKQLIVIE